MRTKRVCVHHRRNVASCILDQHGLVSSTLQSEESLNFTMWFQPT